MTSMVMTRHFKRRIRTWRRWNHIVNRSNLRLIELHCLSRRGKHTRDVTKGVGSGAGSRFGEERGTLGLCFLQPEARNAVALDVEPLGYD